MLRLIQKVEPLSNARDKIGDIEGLSYLIEKASDVSVKDRNRAVTVLARHRGVPFSCIARFLHKSPDAIRRYWKKYEEHGVIKLFEYYPNRPKTAEDKQVQSAVFSILHSPPRDHGINRTSWKMDDLRICLAQDGLILSKDVIREVIKSAGYRWRKAKVVLTSNDPEYKTKLSRI